MSSNNIRPSKYPVGPDEEAELFDQAVAAGRLGKQDTLISGTNIKTINGASVLGTGDLTVSSSASWGSITGTLSSQTDLNTALSGKASTGAVTGTGITMSTARILGRSTSGTGAIEEITVGTGLTLSAGTLSASGGSSSLTVGTSPITSGTVGRILFEGTGNVLQQSANLFWDNTNARLGIGTSSPTAPVNIVGGTETFAGYQRSLWLKTSTNAKSSVELILENTFTTTGRMYEIASYSDGSFNITDRTNSGLRFKIDNTYVQFHSSAAANANLIGTVATINALWFNQTSATATTSNYTLCNVSGLTLLNAPTGGSIYFRIGNSNKALLTNGGNLLLNTTTDAGYKLDVNGTARVQNTLTVTSSSSNGALSLTQNGVGFAAQYIYRPNVTNTIATLMFQDLKSGANFKSFSLGIGRSGDPQWTNSDFIFGYYSGSGSWQQSAKIFNASGNWQIENGTGTSDIATAILQVNSTTKGFLPPRMTNAQMLAIATPAAGLVVYDTTNNKHCGYDGTAWQNFY